MTYLTTKALKAEMLMMEQALRAEIAAVRASIPPAPVGAPATPPAVPATDAADWRVLPDGTRQFIGTPDPTINLVPNVPPAIGPEWGPGAMVRRKGVLSDPSYLVTALVGDWGVHAEHKSGNPTVLEFPPAQLDLVRRAPGT